MAIPIPRKITHEEVETYANALILQYVDRKGIEDFEDLSRTEESSGWGSSSSYYSSSWNDGKGSRRRRRSKSAPERKDDFRLPPINGASPPEEGKFSTVLESIIYAHLRKAYECNDHFNNNQNDEFVLSPSSQRIIIQDGFSIPFKKPSRRNQSKRSQDDEDDEDDEFVSLPPLSPSFPSKSQSRYRNVTPTTPTTPTPPTTPTAPTTTLTSTSTKESRNRMRKRPTTAAIANTATTVTTTTTETTVTTPESSSNDNNNTSQTPPETITTPSTPSKENDNDPSGSSTPPTSNTNPKGSGSRRKDRPQSSPSLKALGVIPLQFSPSSSFGGKYSKEHWIPDPIRQKMVHRDMECAVRNLEFNDLYHRTSLSPFKGYKSHKLHGSGMSGNGRGSGRRNNGSGNKVKSEAQQVLPLPRSPPSPLERSLAKEKFGLEHRKPCGLCTQTFLPINLVMAVPLKAIFDIRDSWSDKFDPDGVQQPLNFSQLRVNSSLKKAPSCYDKTRVCAFCAQLFDKQQETYRPSYEAREASKEKEKRMEEERRKKIASDRMNDPYRICAKVEPLVGGIF